MSWNYNHILVAVDGSENGKKAFLKACDAVKGTDSKLFVVHVVDSRSLVAVQHYNKEIVDEMETSGKEMLQGYVSEAKSLGVQNIESKLYVGSPRHKLARDIPKELDIDVIFVGATGLNAIERMVLGSVSEHIARNARCDVLIVKNEPTDR